MYTLSQTHVSFLLRQPLITHYIENAGVLAKATRILQITEKTEVTALSEVSTVLGRFIPTEGKYVARGARPEVTEDDTPSPGDFVTPPLDLHWPVDAPKIYLSHLRIQRLECVDFREELAERPQE